MSQVGWDFARTLTWPIRAEYAESLYRKIIFDRSTVAHKFPKPLNEAIARKAAK